MANAVGSLDLREKTQALLNGALKHVKPVMLAAALLPLGAIAAPEPGHALCVSVGSGCGGAKHSTDGAFNLHNGGSPTSAGPEWDGVDVAKVTFPVVGVTGGADLYVEQNTGKLFLMYDYWNSPTVNNTASFFDVFFQVTREGEDYLIRFNTAGGIIAEKVKPTGTASQLNPDGSFDLTDPIWQNLDAGDSTLAAFSAAVGFGPSPASAASHFLGEFELTFDTTFGGGSPTGLYDPAPAFWSASFTGDPPISSAIFTLNPDGTTTVIPVFAANGGPAQQPQDVVPEPSSLALVAMGLAGLLGLAWTRRRRE